jgi:hypothetical protein
MKRLKLITKSSQKVMGPMKLKCSCLITAGLTSGRRQLRAKSVKLTPNNRKLIKEVLNCSVTPGFKAKPDAHRMYAQDQVVIHTVRM